MLNSNSKLNQAKSQKEFLTDMEEIGKKNICTKKNRLDFHPACREKLDKTVIRNRV